MMEFFAFIGLTTVFIVVMFMFVYALCAVCEKIERDFGSVSGD